MGEEIGCKTSRVLSVVSLFNGVLFFFAVVFGFGSYVVKEMGFWSMYGDVSRASMVALAFLVFTLMITAWCYRGLRRKYNTKMATCAVVFIVITCVLLIVTISFALTNPLRGRDYWVWNIFEELQAGVTYMQLSFVTYIVFGVTQILMGKTPLKIQKHMKRDRLTRTTGRLLIASGIMFIGILLPFYLIPIFEVCIILSLLFCFAQIMSSVVFWFNGAPTSSN